jgi:hypothetical protein
MPVTHTGARRRRTSRAVSAAALFILICASALSASAQNTFSSGSTGADGAFAPTASQTIVVPDSGVYNFTTVNIPANVTVTFARNNLNKPLTILASGAVTIAGSIVIDGQPGAANGAGGYGGPGGYNGGTGGYAFDQTYSGVPGEGPGGGGGGIGSANNSSGGGGGGGGYGTAGAAGNGNTGVAGPRFGATTIQPLIGGSGGGGGAAFNARGGAGGGGGGAILIAGSSTITINGNIYARGGLGGTGNAGGGGGSGGAVRLIANTVLGSGSLNVAGGGGGSYNWSFGGGAGGQGYVRVESYDYSSFNATSTPSNIISFALPHPITVANGPGLRIASVGGVSSPSAPLGSLQGVPDVVVPSTMPNPVSVAIEGANIPVGTVVSVTLMPARGSRTTVPSSGLAGTEAASTATASVSLPTGMCVLSATATIDLQTASAKPVYIEGERVNRIEVAATFGGPSEVTYVTQSGRRIKRASE